MLKNKMRKFIQLKPYKWQILPRYGREIKDETTIKHYGLLKFFGARLHIRLEIDAYEFRLAYFDIVYLPGFCERRVILHLPIPFLKKDIGIGIHRESSLYG